MKKALRLIESRCCLPILLVAVIAIIAGVGQWVSTQWASLRYYLKSYSSDFCVALLVDLSRTAKRREEGLLCKSMRRVPNMRWLAKLMDQLRSDEKGAALIECTVLLAILLVAVIAIIAGVGQWVSTQWASLSTGI